MNNFDIIVIGGGLTGSALGYELAKQNCKVLLLEKNLNFGNATTYSYGGISYWCGSDDLTIKLCEEGINIHRYLSDELEMDTEFRELDLLFTIDSRQNPQETFSQYQHFHIKPRLLDIQETLEIEPLINKNAIAGSLLFPQGHVNPEKIILGYQNAMIKLGGKVEEDSFISFIQKDNKITGIKTQKNQYNAPQVVICAGGFSRQILLDLGLNIPLYFSQAQLIKTISTEIKLQALVMPATTQRLDTEKLVSEKTEDIWENPQDKLYGDVLEAGAIQFLDGSLCLGQISQIIPYINPLIDSKASAERLRSAIAHILPSLAQLEGKWYNYPVAFTQGMPFQVKKVKEIEGLSIFSGFTSPFVFVPPLARRFARSLVYNLDYHI